MIRMLADSEQRDEFPRPMGFILNVHAWNSNIQIIGKRWTPASNGIHSQSSSMPGIQASNSSLRDEPSASNGSVHSRPSVGMAGHEYYSNNNNRKPESIIVKRLFCPKTWQVASSSAVINVEQISKMNFPRPMGVHPGAFKKCRSMITRLQE